jgi:hypothetical protein
MQSANVTGDDGARPVARLCPVCGGPMQIVNVESAPPGMPAGMERRTIRCSVCELVAVHTFAREAGW